VTVSECCLIKLLPHILLEKYIYMLVLEMASRGNQHCAKCIGTLSLLVRTVSLNFVGRLVRGGWKPVDYSEIVHVQLTYTPAVCL